MRLVHRVLTHAWHRNGNNAGSALLDYGDEMSKNELQRSKAKLQDSLGRMAGHMNALEAHMQKTEAGVAQAAQAGHAFLGEIDEAAAQYIAELGQTSNGPEDAVNQPEAVLEAGRDQAVGDTPPAATE